MHNRTAVMLLDWGDTLMKNHPQSAGKMADWDVVTAIDGALQGLSAVKALGVTTAIVSGAQDSSPADIMRALARVGLDGLIDHVYTSAMFDKPKTDGTLYTDILHHMNCLAEDAMMVGDSYATDVLSPFSAGIRAAWYNPVFSLDQITYPVHGFELYHMQALPDVLNQEDLPGLPDCKNIMAAHGVPENIQRHCHMTAKAAYALACMMNQAGVKVNTILTQRAALLHDLDKLASLNGQGEHGRLGQQLLTALGYPALGRIVGKHVLDMVLDETIRYDTWEEKLVYFADKLVEGERYVLVTERLAALGARYPVIKGKNQALQQVLLQLEAEIFNIIGKNSKEFIENLKNINKIE